VSVVSADVRVVISVHEQQLLLLLALMMMLWSSGDW